VVPYGVSPVFADSNPYQAVFSYLTRHFHGGNSKVLAACGTSDYHAFKKEVLPPGFREFKRLRSLKLFGIRII
jgi:hypothetical protein